VKSDTSYEIGARDREYIEEQSTLPEPALLAIEAAAEPERIPILDRDSGRVLAVLAADRKRIVEIGTAYGYSTLWMALAQPAGGTIVTIDPDRSRTDLARGWWRQAGVPDDQIRVVNRPALDAFADADDPALAGPFDLAFIDALKPEYTAYVQALLSRLTPGALIVADNVLWSGRVSGARDANGDSSTPPLRAFNGWLLSDQRFQATILPVGDGLLVARFRG
jgi:predicted O-methyltransferase YrrM